jgi:hypothetical protein
MLEPNDEFGILLAAEEAVLDVDVQDAVRISVNAI